MTREQFDALEWRMNAAGFYGNLLGWTKKNADGTSWCIKPTGYVNRYKVHFIRGPNDYDTVASNVDLTTAMERCK